MAFAEVAAGPVSLLDKIRALDEVFYLTGSQYFVGRGNDLDYFAEYSDALAEHLASIGFNAISQKQYGDDNCLLVLRGFDFNNLQIDIQLVKNVDLKAKVQEKFRELGYSRPSQADWNLAFKLLA